MIYKMQLISREQLDHTLQFPSTGRHYSGLYRTNCPQVRSRSRVSENQARQGRESATRTSSRLSLPSANSLDVRFTLRCTTEHTSQWYLVVLVSSPRGGSHLLLHLLTTRPSGPTLHRTVRNGHLCVDYILSCQPAHASWVKLLPTHGCTLDHAGSCLSFAFVQDQVRRHACTCKDVTWRCIFQAF